MFVSHKSNVVLQIQETEWLCRMLTKGMDTPEYWAWLESVTTDGVPDYSGEDYEIVETEVDVQGFYQSGHIISTVGEGITYHLSWDGTAVSADDTAKSTWELAEEWKQIRAQRNRLLSESDWTQGADSPLTTQQKSDWAVYRTSLRTLPEDQSSVTSYSDINWPTKPS